MVTKRSRLMKRKQITWSAAFVVLAVVMTGMPLGCQRGETESKKTDSTSQSAAELSDKPDSGPKSRPDDSSTAAETGAPSGAPLGLEACPIPADNPMTREKIALGRLLFFDKRLSWDGTLSCATCHDPAMGWADNAATSAGFGGHVGRRNAPSVVNAAYSNTLFWDGRATSLEELALLHIESPFDMGHTRQDLVDQLNQIPQYKEQFQNTFGTDVTSAGIAKAIAAFERTILSGNSPYDQYMAGDQTALTAPQKRGMELFNSAGCAICHSPPLFTNFRYYNAGVGSQDDNPDEGRKEVTKREDLLGCFRVPSLREVARTAPYFHDGSAKTLEDAVAVMAQGGVKNANRSVMLESVGEKQFTEQNLADIVEFLKTLSGEFPVIEPPVLP